MMEVSNNSCDKERLGSLSINVRLFTKLSLIQLQCTTKCVLHTSISCSKWLMIFTSNTICSPLMRSDGTPKDKEKSLETVSCRWNNISESY